MKKNNPILKSILVLIVVSIFGYLSLDVPQVFVEDLVETQLESLDQKESEDVGLVQDWYQVLSVIDGDTLRVDVDGQSQTVRVLGIDTPETEFSPVGEECHATEATAYAKHLLEGNKVQLEFDPAQPKTDVYDRLLAYVQLPEGKDFGELMIADGFAREYTYKNNTYSKQALYKKVENTAKGKQKGVWSCEE
jgi:endonuclease YncB( thermonuclease family)